MDNEEFAHRYVDYAEWMVKSGQFNGSTTQYLSFARYQTEDQKIAVQKEWARRKYPTPATASDPAQESNHA